MDVEPSPGTGFHHPPGGPGYLPPPGDGGKPPSVSAGTVPGAASVGLAATLVGGPPAGRQRQRQRTTPPQEGIGAARSGAESGLAELVGLQRRRRLTGDAGVHDLLRVQSADVLGDLRALREEVSGIILEAESHRWRRWLFGGVV